MQREGRTGNDNDQMSSSSGVQTTDRSVATDTQHPMQQYMPEPLVHRLSPGHAVSTAECAFIDCVGDRNLVRRNLQARYT